MSGSSQIEMNSPSNVGYNRVAIRKGASSGDLRQSSVSSISTKDRLMCFLTGENEDVRTARLQLSGYLKLLEAECARLGVARSQHYDGGKKLFEDFERQKLQLQKWGLHSLIPAFQMQVMSTPNHVYFCSCWLTAQISSLL